MLYYLLDIIILYYIPASSFYHFHRSQYLIEPPVFNLCESQVRGPHFSPSEVECSTLVIASTWCERLLCYQDSMRVSTESIIQNNLHVWCRKCVEHDHDDDDGDWWWWLLLWHRKPGDESWNHLGGPNSDAIAASPQDPSVWIQKL